jgi:hypothetical protein
VYAVTETPELVWEYQVPERIYSGSNGKDLEDFDLVGWTGRGMGKYGGLGSAEDWEVWRMRKSCW